MQEGACLPLFVFLPRQFLQPLLRHEERVSFCVRDRDVEATRIRSRVAELICRHTIAAEF
jgi:hypothetical protein